MKRDAIYFASLPYRVIRGMEAGRYTSQAMEFSALIGKGATAAEADRDLEDRLLKLCLLMQGQGAFIPVPRLHDEATFFKVWNAAFTSLLTALDTEGVVITSDATGDVLTLAASIREKIETAGNSPVEMTPEMTNAIRCAVEVLDGEAGGYSADAKYAAKCQLMTLLGEANAARQQKTVPAKKQSAKKKATAK